MPIHNKTTKLKNLKHWSFARFETQKTTAVPLPCTNWLQCDNLDSFFPSLKESRNTFWLFSEKTLYQDMFQLSIQKVYNKSKNTCFLIGSHFHSNKSISMKRTQQICVGQRARSKPPFLFLIQPFLLNGELIRGWFRNRKTRIAGYTSWLIFS